MDEAFDMERDTRGQWFVIHTLSGHENKVKESIERQIRISDQIPVYEVFIPTEKVAEVRNNKKTTTTRKLFPGYLWIRMDLYDELGDVDQKAWYLIRNVQGVLGFLGSENKPTPLSSEEVEELMRPAASGEDQVKPKIVYEVGETVRIKDGAFENCEGTIQEIDNERGKLSIMVSIFGRSTPTELEFWQVERPI